MTEDAEALAEILRGTEYCLKMATLRAEKAEADALTAYARGLDDAAKVADKLNGWGSDCGSGGHAAHIAAAIRALAPDSE